MVMLNWFVRDPTPVLEGVRVLLRPPRPRDFEAWRKLRRESRDFLKPYEPRWTEADLNRQAFGARLIRGRNEAKRGTDFSFLVFDRSGGSEVLVGGLTISNIRRRAAQYANLGYWMGERHAGKGHMTEAVRGALRFAFSDLALHRVEAACLPENEPSRRLLERVGFKREGLARGYLRINGNWCDHLLYGVLSSDRLPTG